MEAKSHDLPSEIWKHRKASAGTQADRSQETSAPALGS